MKGKGQTKKSLILGATGAAGNELLRLMIHDKTFSTIYVPHRSPLKYEHQKIKSMPFDEIYHPWNFKDSLDDFFYCFGSTLKKSKSLKEFYELEIKTAQQSLLLAKHLRVKHLYIISTKGITPHKTHGYFKIKAEVEKIFSDHPFETIYIYRPSLLITPRVESRPLEYFAQKVSSPLSPWLQRYWPNSAPIRVDQLVKTILYDAHHKENGVVIRENNNILDLSLLYQQ